METDLSGRTARLEEIDKALTAMTADRDAFKEKADVTVEQVAKLRSQLATMEETLAQERKASDEKLDVLNKAQETLENRFKVLAEEVMTKHGEAFKTANKEQVEGLLSPLKESIMTFQTVLQNSHTEGVKANTTLQEMFKAFSEQAGKMRSETENLTKALRGKGKTQGDWGEYMLESILEGSGLREGQEFERQKSHTTEDGGRQRTDVIVNLPSGRKVIIDSKVSLTAYVDLVAAEGEGNETAAEAALNRHVASVRQHIKTLGTKEYQTSVSGSLETVVMFVPIEPALGLALQHDNTLHDLALKNNVTLVTSNTLMLGLRSIANLWQVERGNRSALEIVDRAGKLYDKFVGFLADLEGVRKGLDAATTAYEDAVKKASWGRDNVVTQFQKLKDLGAKASKAIPEKFLGEDAEELSRLAGRQPALQPPEPEDVDGEPAIVETVG